MACSKLSTSDLSKVRNEILPAATKWYDIGLELGMTVEYLETIKKTNDDPQDCLRELLRRWLSGVDPLPSWKALITALNTPVVNYQALASEIKERYSSGNAEIHERSVSCHLNANNLNVTDPDKSVLPNQFASPRSTPKPKLKPRRQRNASVLADHEERKYELVQLFKGISSREVSPDQIEKARQCIKHGGTRSERYQLVEFEKVLNENRKIGRADYLDLMISSYDLLLKLVTNLIKPERPNPSFKEGPQLMKGYESILQIAGYNEDASMEDVLEPDKGKLSVLAAELLMAKLEVEQMNKAATIHHHQTVSHFTSSVTDGSALQVPSIKVTRHDQSSEEGPIQQTRKPKAKPRPTRARTSQELMPSPASSYHNSPDSPATDTYNPEHTAMYNGCKFNFNDPPSSNLFCQQCNSLAHEPYQFLCCNSLICKQCIVLSTCPFCLKHSESFPDHRSDKLIQSHEVWCPNAIAAGLGCEWKGELRKVPHHRKECARELVSCSYSVVGCEEKMYRSNVEKHEKESRETHLNLAMKKVVTLSIAVKEMQESIEQLKAAVLV